MSTMERANVGSSVEQFNKRAILTKEQQIALCTLHVNFVVNVVRYDANPALVPFKLKTD